MSSLPHGVIVPVVTPFTGEKTLDEPALDRVLNHVIEGGVHGIFLLGTTGEGPSLPLKMQERVIRKAMQTIVDRVPVYVAVTDTSLENSITLAEVSASAGATAAVLAPSPYFPANTSAQVDYFNEFASRSPLPLLLYNIPQMTKTAIDLTAFRALVENPKIIGIKDSSGLMVYFHRLQHIARIRTDFSLLMGAEELTAESILSGADGVVTGGANCFPKLYRQMFDHARAGNLEALRPLQERLMSLSCEMYAHDGGGYIIPGIKAILHQMRICEPWVLPPLCEADQRLTAIAQQMRHSLANVHEN